MARFLDVRACPKCNRIKTGKGYCTECQKLAYRVDIHDPMKRKRYGKAWQKARRRKLLSEPFCHDCGTVANEVHHIVKVVDGGTNRQSNLMSLCKPCHSSRTGRGE